MQESCPDYFDIADHVEFSDTQSIMAFNRFHAVGHAIMYAEENDVFEALFQCDKLPHEWMKDSCYYGAFMEQVFLYYSDYHPRLSRPFVDDGTMVQLCERVEERHRQRCSHFVGAAFLDSNPHAFKDAFVLCNSLRDNQYIETCIWCVAQIHILGLFQDDLKGIIEMCKDAGLEYEHACINGAANGIRLGTAGTNNKTRPLFCNLVKERFYEDCLGK